MELIKFYQLPTIDYIQIKVRVSSDCDLNKTYSKNNLIAELYNRILCFSLIDNTIPRSNNTKSIKVCCYLRLKYAVIHLTFSLTYIYRLSEVEDDFDKYFDNNSFLQSYKAEITYENSIKSLEIDGNISSSRWYGAKISKRCMFIISDEYFKHHDNPIKAFGYHPSISSNEATDILLSLHSRDVVSILLGSIDSVFGTNSIDESQRVKNNSILLIGGSGSGCSSLIHSIASKYYCFDLNIIEFSIGSLLAKINKTRRDLSSIHLLIKQEWLHTLLLASTYHNSLLILSDLHTLTPRIVMTDHNNAITEDIVEMIYDSLSLFTSLSAVSVIGDNNDMFNGNKKKVLIVGRTYQEELVDERVLGIFKEKVLVPLPSTKERRCLFRYISKSYFNISNDLYNSYDIDSLSDNCSSIPIMSLLHKAKQLIQNKINNLNPNYVSDIHISFNNPNNNNKNTNNNSKNNNISTKIDPFSQVAGHSLVKKILTETILWPRHYALLYHTYIRNSSHNNNNNNQISNNTMGAISPVGVLLFGPPGTGKTMLPRELSRKIGCTIINLGLVDVIRGEIGEGERRVNEIFKEAKRSAPCIIFIDEFQAIFTSRDDTSSNMDSDIGSTLSSTLAGCFDDLNTWNKYAGHESLVTVIASTNEPWAIDRSFLRPNRLEKCIFVGPLDCEGREEFLRNIELYPLSLDQEWIKTIASLTDGFTGADMCLLIRKLEYESNKQDDNQMSSSSSTIFSLDKIVNMIESMTPSVSTSEIKEYLDWQKH